MQYTRYPAGLARALDKITKSINKGNLCNVVAAMCIVNPMEIYWGTSRSIYSTHPRTKIRIKILNSMVSCDYNDYNTALKKITDKNYDISNKYIDQTRKVSPDSANKPQNTPSNAENSYEGIPLLKEEPENDQKFQINLLLKEQGYIFINCDCSTILKIPPAYKDQKITCPHCGKEHSTGA